MARRITRREFIETTTLTAAGLAAASADAGAAAAALPTRPFGRTGLQVTCLAFGCGSRFLMYEQEAVAVDVLNSAVDSGHPLPGHRGRLRRRRERASRRSPHAHAAEGRRSSRPRSRDSARTRDAALRQVEASLKRLQTDHVDVLHLHDLTDAQDLAAIEAPDGALKALYELRSQKVTRAIGMTSHTDGAVMAKAIEQNDLDCVQMAMNPARALQFEELALPAAKRKGLGVILMKVTSQEKLVGAGPGKTDIVEPPPVCAQPAGLHRRRRDAEARVRRGEHRHRARLRADGRAGDRSRPEERGAAAGGGRSVLQRARGCLEERIPAGTRSPGSTLPPPAAARRPPSPARPATQPSASAHADPAPSAQRPAPGAQRHSAQAALR